MSNLSPAAIALEADLCLLTRLPLPRDANLDAIKERVFGSEEGVPRTEDESKRRYVDAIVEAFNVVGVYRIDDFPKEVKNLLHKYNLANIKHSQVSAQLKAAQGTLDDMHEQHNDAQRLSAALEKENAAFRKAVEDRLKEQGEAPTNVNRDFVLARRRANDLELEVGQLRVENTDLKCAYRSLTAERDSLRDELKKAREYYDSWQDALNRVQELRAEMVEQENSYNLLALVVVDLLKGRGVE